jgi:hypothetical protein
VKYDFNGIKEFPLVLGTLIPIKAPSVDEHLYVSRKGYHAINIQCVCDANYMIRDIVAKWPGATHDAHKIIWNNCKLAKAFEDGTIKGAWLLGEWICVETLAIDTHSFSYYSSRESITKHTNLRGV